MKMGALDGEPPIVRIHSQCLTGDVFHSLRCDCRAQLEIALTGLAAHSVSGRVLTSATMDAHNSFATPHALEPAVFGGAVLHGGRLSVELPAKSVVVLDLH